MNILNLKQGSKEWLDFRATRFNASEAPAMMGASKYMSRDELLNLKKTGESKPVDSFTQKLFDNGHKAEAAIRPHIEKIIEQELYPATGEAEIEGIMMGSSFDGLTMDRSINFEHKLFNEQLAAQVAIGEISDHYRWQMDQQMMLSGAEKTIFVVSDGTPEKMIWLWYERDESRFPLLISGWQQFGIDLENYQPAIETVKPEADSIMELPALMIEISGGVKSSNLVAYQSSALSFIESINTDLQTDSDFANAEATVKFCGEAEKRLDLVKAQALEQTADISELFRTIDNIKEEMRSKRLTLDKLVKSEKANIKRKIAEAAKAEIDDYVLSLNESTGYSFVIIQTDFNEAMKGKKTITSLKSAANDHVAQCKIKAGEEIEKVRKNLAVIPDEYKFLFNDLAAIITKSPDDFNLLAQSRINDHKKAEEERLEIERERIRKEEAEKAEQAVAEKAIENANSDFPAIDLNDHPITAGVLTGNGEYIGKVSDIKITKEFSEEALVEIIDSLIENGIGKTVSKKVAQLIIDSKIKHVTLNKYQG